MLFSLFAFGGRKNRHSQLAEWRVPENSIVSWFRCKQVKRRFTFFLVHQARDNSGFGLRDIGGRISKGLTMETKTISLKDIAIDPLAKELAESEEAPYIDYFMKTMTRDAAGTQAALKVLRDLPLEKRYIWRVFSALKWALADFDDECVRLDLPNIPEAKRAEILRELEMRFRQLRMLLAVFHEEQAAAMAPKAPLRI